MNMNESVAVSTGPVVRTLRRPATAQTITLRSYLLRAAWLATEVSEAIEDTYREGIVAC